MFDKEFNDESLGSKLCKLLIVKDPNSESELNKFLTKYLKLSKSIQRVIGFDIEFNTPPGSKGQRQIAIFQISFYLSGYILTIFFNPKLVKQQTNQLIHELFTSKKILKIGHGTDSLDIPAIYEYLGSEDKILDFTTNLYDTRFLCEFENTITGSKLCNIYHLIEKFNVVTDKQLKWLKANEETLGDFWKKKIDIQNLSNEFRDYSMYDALYLKKLLGKMKSHFKTNKWDYKLVIQTTQFVFLIKRDIIKLDDITYLNLGFISNKTRLYDLFYSIYNDFIVQLDPNSLGIFSIGYFKNQLIKILIHGFYYLILSNGIKVFKSANSTVDFEDLNKLKNSWDKLKKYLELFKSINKLIYKFLKFAKTRL